MYCTKCGKKLEDGKKYCIYCGAEVKNVPAAPLPEGAKPDKKKLILFAAALAVLLLAIVLGGRGINGLRYQHQLSLGERYLSEMEYDAAIVAFDKAIAIDPRRAEAYLGKADAYIGLDDLYTAMDVVNEGLSMTGGDERLQDKMDEIIDLMEERERLDFDYMPSQEESVPTLTLNYVSVVRWVDSEDTEVQLAVMNGDVEQDAADYTWSSGNDSVAEVSAGGLVSCKTTEGNASIRVEDADGNWAVCEVYIIQRSEEIQEDYYSEMRFYIEGENTVTYYYDGDEQKPTFPYYRVEISNFSPNNGEDEEGEDEQEFSLSMGNLLYFSGEVRIPDHLIYKGTERPIHAVRPDVYLYSYEMTKITIPESIDNLTGWNIDNPFYYCTGLQEIVVEEGNESFMTIDGVLFTSDGKTLLAYPAQKEGDTYTIPASVEEIAAGAFYGNENLERIEVEEGNAVYRSEDGVVINERDAELTVYPSGKKDSFYEIPSGIARIGKGAFGKVPALQTVTGSEELNVIEEPAFEECENLESVTGLEKMSRLSALMFRSCPILAPIYGGSETVSYTFGDNSWGWPVDCQEISSRMPGLIELSVGAEQLQNMESLRDLPELSSLTVQVFFTDSDGEAKAEQMEEQLKELLPDCEVECYAWWVEDL